MLVFVVDTVVVVFFSIAMLVTDSPLAYLLQSCSLVVNWSVCVSRGSDFDVVARGLSTFSRVCNTRPNLH